MKLEQLSLALCLLILGNKLAAQSFEGVWKGTSLCQVKNSPCHDENVVFYVTKDNNRKTFIVKANKLVNGKEDFMGTIVFTYDQNQDEYVSIDKERDSKWSFKISGNTLKGTLVSRGALFRLIDLKKDH